MFSKEFPKGLSHFVKQVQIFNWKVNATKAKKSVQEMISIHDKKLKFPLQKDSKEAKDHDEIKIEKWKFLLLKEFRMAQPGQKHCLYVLDVCGCISSWKKIAVDKVTQLKFRTNMEFTR